MPAITDLVNSIVDSVDTLLGIANARNDGSPSYHLGESDFKLIQSQITQGNWNNLPFAYTFSVININSPSDNGGFSDFALPLAPGTINQKEPPAINIRATQGGTSVNHNGVGYKDLNISGTTGVAPFRGAGGVNNKTGQGIFTPNQLKYKSGYEVFLHLRNWFRTYYEFKKKRGKAAADYRLVWKNYKDGEFLIVELLSFEMDRNAQKPFMYDYKLEFKVLANYSVTNPNSTSTVLEDLDKALDTALNYVQVARGIMLASQGILRQIESTYNATILEPLRVATLAIKAALGVPLVAADISNRIVVNTVSQAKALLIVSSEAAKFQQLQVQGQSDQLAQINKLVDPRIGSLTNTLNLTTQAINQNGSAGLTSLGGVAMQTDGGVFPQKTLDAAAIEQSDASDLPRSFYQTAVDNLERVKQNAEDFFNLGSPEYDALFDRTASLVANPNVTVTSQQYDLLNGFNDAIIAMYMVMTSVSNFKAQFSDIITDMNNRFNNTITLQSSQSVFSIKLPSNTTLERIAQEQLGDSTRWGEIAEANGLQFPFISDDINESRPGVIGAGQSMLIPQPVVNGFSQAPQGPDNKLTVNMDDLEKSFGTDLKVTESFDLSLTSGNDFDIIAGGPNLGQAVVLKFFYEPGEVINHPQIGAGILPGRKFPALADIKDGIINSLLQDPRIDNIVGLALTRQDNELSISFDIKVKQIDVPIPVKIKLPAVLQNTAA